MSIMNLNKFCFFTYNHVTNQTRLCITYGVRLIFESALTKIYELIKESVDGVSFEFGVRLI